MLTRCPHCQATFQVTPQQLEIAAGKVRCGACMKVFDALASSRQMGTGAPAPDTASKTPAPSSPKEPALHATDEDDMVFLDNPDEDAKEGSYTRKEAALDMNDLSDSFLSLDESVAAGKIAPAPEHDESVDESWAEEILETSRQKQRTAKPVPAPVEPPPHEPIDAVMSAVRDEPPLTAQHDRPRHTAQATMVPVSERKPATAPNPYAGLRSAPIAVSSYGGGRWRKILLTLVTLALLAALGAQLLWFERDTYSRVPQLRPYYAKLCDLAGCKLPPLVALDLIVSEKLVVRNHPEQKRALIVEANIVNRARFPQPMPAIALTFSDLAERVVAQRLFQPSEYLAGDAKSLETMPAGTPIRISLEVKDPGRDAVNYAIEFFPARANTETP